MIENVLIKEVNDPSQRCTALIAGNTRQCIYRREPGSEKCLLHAGMAATKKLEEQKIKNYRLHRYQRRVSELADSEGVKSLREEIGILRVVLEEILNSCETTNDLIMYSQKISSIARDIERLVVSCHRLESSLGFLIDKTTVLNISNQIVQVVSSHIKDNHQLDTIVDQIVEVISSNGAVIDPNIIQEEDHLEQRAKQLINQYLPNGSEE